MERPKNIRRDGKNYLSKETMHEWHPWIKKHTDNVPLKKVLQALGLNSFMDYGTLWIERIDKVGNAYMNFEHVGNFYSAFYIPMPAWWDVVRNHISKKSRMQALLGLLEGDLKYDVYFRHIAPTSAILRAVRMIEKKQTAFVRKIPADLRARLNEIRRKARVASVSASRPASRPALKRAVRVQPKSPLRVGARSALKKSSFVPLWDRPPKSTFRELKNVGELVGINKVVIIWRSSIRQEMRVFCDNDVVALTTVRIITGKVPMVTMSVRGKRHDFRISREQYEAAG